MITHTVVSQRSTIPKRNPTNPTWKNGHWSHNLEHFEIQALFKIFLVALPLGVLNLCALQGPARLKRYTRKFYTYTPQPDQTFFSSMPLYITHSMYLPFWYLHRNWIVKRQGVHLTHKFAVSIFKVQIDDCKRLQQQWYA